MRYWLVAAAPNNQTDSAAATNKLAQLLQTQNGDGWLTNFLRARRAGDRPALLALSKAISRNVHGEYREAKLQAEQAVALFKSAGNNPGRLRAQFEVAYANQRLLQSNSCLRDTQLLEAEVLSTDYRWLRTQLALEHAVCLYLNGKMSAVQEQMERALQGAIKFNFPILRLRTYALEAAMLVENNCDETWKVAYQGLDVYWQGQAFPHREYELISPIKQCFEKRGLWWAAEALQQRMLKIQLEEIDPEDRNLLLQITAYESLAQIERELGKDDEARKATAQAHELVHQVDESVASIFTIPPKLKLAELQMDNRDLEGSLATIQEVQEDLKQIDSPFFDLTFSIRSAEVRSAMGQQGEAEEAYEKAIEIAENRLRQYKTEQDRLRWMNEASAAYRGLAAEWLEHRRNMEAAKLIEWSKGRPFEQPSTLRQEKRTIEWQDIEKSILNQSLPLQSGPRLIYLSGRSSLYIFTIRDGVIESTPVKVTRGELQQRIFRYIRHCSMPIEPNSGLPVLEKESKDLFASLLQPVMERLRGAATVTIELDAAMNGLPLEALMDHDGRFFAEKYPVIYSPGYIRESHLRQPSPQPLQAGLAINALDGPLKFSYQGLLQQSYSAMEFKDGADTVAGDLPALLESRELFAFFGHAYDAKLYLTNKTVAVSGDFPPQSLRSLQLVILAACASASGEGSSRQNVNTEGGVRNLVYTFQSGGTPQVIASHWDVNENATIDLMSSLLRHLVKGKAAPRALFEAKKTMILINRQPYFWASFALYGREGGPF